MDRSLRFIAAASLAIGASAFCFETPAIAAPPQSNGQSQGQGDQQTQQGQGNQQAQQGQGQLGQQGQQAHPGGGTLIYRRVFIYGALVPQNSPQESHQGFSQIQLKDGPAIRDSITKLTDSVIDQKSSTKLLDCLTSQDQQRLSKAFKSNDQQLASAVSQIQKAWQQKYNAQFNPQEAMANFGRDFTILEGQVSNPKLLSDWPVPQTGESANTQQNNQGQNSQQQAQQGQQQAQQPQQAQAGQNNKSEQFAVVVFPATDKLPETNVSLLKQGNTWKIDVPDDLNGKQLEQNLSKQLQEVSQSNSLPADQKMAYREIAHHIAMALYDQQAGEAGGAQGAIQPGQPNQQGQQQGQQGQNH